MASELNHRCLICGRRYHTCDDCLKKHSFTPWRSITDTKEHYQLFLLLCDYRDGYLSRKAAREKLSRIDFSLDECREGVRQQLMKILGEDPAAN
ncbi:hypothetical protein MUB23_11620 [Cuneatibacter sp. NSJ-177]|uniref:hypothetical protein n=1 Tax=Cuneatibacter sp. NSJ-177 TaxID=2931401 RepID=UPI001FD041FD|nr:hypothetical protein [Cuneatibacter sp. NSJ-177]MCJ7836030.1 hypothetical protein [Cuneatibacter sp. NSJ-177]